MRGSRRSIRRATGSAIVEKGAIAARDGRIVYAGPGGGPSRRLGRRGCRGRRLRGPLDHARPDRLPHASRPRRRPRAGIRAAPEGRELRGDRARRRRHPLHRAGDARGERGRARRAIAAAPRRADRRRRHDDRDQIRLRPRCRNGGAAAPRRAAGSRSCGRSSVTTTFLGAHALPPEADGDKDAYIDRVIAEIAAGARRPKASPTPSTAFARGSPSAPTRSPASSPQPRALGLPVKLHADQLSNLGGAALAARFGALSADHLEYTDEAGAAAMAEAGTVAVLLPGAFYFLRETQAAAGRCVPPPRRADGGRDRHAIPAPRRSPRCFSP